MVKSFPYAFGSQQIQAVSIKATAADKASTMKSR